MAHNDPKSLKFLSVDCVVFSYIKKKINVLLYQRGSHLDHFPLEWALIGGYLQKDERLYNAASRILFERTGIKNKHIKLEQLHTFDELERFPNKRVITVAFWTLINHSEFLPKPGIDAKDVRWYPINKLPDLPFDHKPIVDFAFTNLKLHACHQPIGFKLLPSRFTLFELQEMYEAILETALPKNNFRRKILSMKLLEESSHQNQKVFHRPAKYYFFDPEKYLKRKEEGLIFDLSFKNIPLLMPGSKL